MYRRLRVATMSQRVLISLSSRTWQLRAFSIQPSRSMDDIGQPGWEKRHLKNIFVDLTVLIRILQHSVRSYQRCEPCLAANRTRLRHLHYY